MKKINKLISIFVVAALMLSIVPFGAFAIEDSSTEPEAESLVIEDMTVIENTNGYYFNRTYTYDIRPNFKLRLKNGDQIAGSKSTCYINGEWYDLTVECPDQTENPLLVGNTYTFTGSICGIKADFNFTIIKNPIKSLEINDISILENSHGDYSGDKFIYKYIYPKFKVILENGKELNSTDYSVEIEGIYYNLYTDLDYWGQNQNPWTVGNTYTATGSICGVTSNFNINIKGGIESLEISDISLKPYTNGYYSGDDFIYSDGYFEPEFKIKLKNGDIIYGSKDYGSMVYIYDEPYYLDINYPDQQKSPWIAGETYKGTASILGVETDFNIKIEESPIKSLEIEGYSIIEYTNGSYSGENFIYSIYSSPKFKVTLKNGSVINSNGNSGVSIGDEHYSLVIGDSDQHQNPWVAGNTYSVPCSLGGVKADLNIKIVETPVKEVIIEDISIEEYSGGYYSDGTYIYDTFWPECKVIFKDGSEASFSFGIDYNGKYYRFEYDTSEQTRNPWTAGNTYQVTASVLGVKGTFNVTITEGSVESVTVENTSIIAGFNRIDGIYQLCMPPFKVKMKDGRIINSKNSDGGVYDSDHNRNYTLYTNASELQQNEPWKVGNTYTVTAFIGGVSTTFEVSVMENPIESLIVDDVNIYEHKGGYEKDANGESYYIYGCMPTLSVRLRDGTVCKEEEYRKDYSGMMEAIGIYIDNQFYSKYMNCEVTHNQKTEHWGLGTHKAKMEFMGLETEFNVNIYENPIKSVNIADVTITESINGYYGGNYQHCEIIPIAEVTYASGEVIKKDLSTLTIDSYYDGYEGQENTWSSGFYCTIDLTEFKAAAYDYSVTINGVTYPFKVKLVENPIKVSGIEIIKNPLKTVYNAGEAMDISGMTVRIYFNDGTYEDVTSNADGYVYLKKLSKMIGLNVTFASGRLILRFNEYIKEIPITVMEDEIKGITLKSNNGKTFVITVTNSDGSSYDMNIRHAYRQEVYFNDYSNDEKVSYVYLNTDKGRYYCSVHYPCENNKEKYIYIELHIGEKTYRSNYLYGYDFENTFLNISTYWFCTDILEEKRLSRFNGEITAENIDALIYWAYYRAHSAWVYGVNPLKGSEVKETILKYFNVNDIDLTLSKNYDPATDVYILDNRYWTDYSGWDTYLDELNYENGKYTLKCLYYENNSQRTAYITLDDDLRVISIYREYEIGDVNRDGVVDIRDLVHLKKLLAAEKTITNDDPADIDKNNILNALDITALRKILLDIRY